MLLLFKKYSSGVPQHEMTLRVWQEYLNQGRAAYKVAMMTGSGLPCRGLGIEEGDEGLGEKHCGYDAGNSKNTRAKL